MSHPILAQGEDPHEYHWYLLRDLLQLDSVQIADKFKEHPDLGKKHLESVIGARGKLQRLQPDKINISLYNIYEKSYGDVSEIFERINLGTPVKQSQLLLGKLSTVYPGVVSKVEDYLAEVRKKHSCRFDLDLFISSFATTALWHPNVDKLEDYIAEATLSEVKRDLRQTEKVLQEALDFIGEYLFIDTMKYFPAERTLICLSFLFARQPSYMAKKTNCHKIALWIAWAILAGHHNDYRRFARDIAIIESQRDIAEQLIDHLDITAVKWRVSLLSEMDYAISRNNVLFSFVYALVRWKGAVSFLSPRPIETKIVDETDDDEEIENIGNPRAIHEHHIYPVARLKEESAQGYSWITKEWIYDIANFTFLTGRDNQELQDPPVEYLIGIPAKIKSAHLIDSYHYHSGQYEKFLTSRRKLIKHALDEYLDELKTKAGYPWKHKK